MRRRIVLGTAALAGALALAVAPAVPAHHASGHGLDAARMRAATTGRVLKATDGAALSFDRARGDVVVLNFWASWCAPCRREMPALDRLHAEIAPQGGRVVAVSVDHEARNVRSFAKRYGLTMPLYHDGPDGLAKSLDLDALPFTVVLDRGGEVVLTSTGADEAAVARVVETARALVAKRPVANRDGSAR